jgi:CRP/FNR family transcriptional regulator, cyclic AMP receptor protein
MNGRSNPVRSISPNPLGSPVPVLRSKVDAHTLAMLEKVPIFAGLSDKQLRHLAKDSLERTYNADTRIVEQGEKGAAFYLIMEGQAEVKRKGRKLATLGAGSFFGEMALFDEEPRSADVITTKPTRCLVLNKWEFWGFAMTQPAMLRDMLGELARRLSITNKALTE